MSEEWKESISNLLLNTLATCFFPACLKAENGNQVARGMKTVEGKGDFSISLCLISRNFSTTSIYKDIFMLRKEKNLEKVEYRKLTGEDNLGKEATGRQPIIRGIQNFAIGPFDKVVRIEFDLCGRLQL